MCRTTWSLAGPVDEEKGSVIDRKLEKECKVDMHPNASPCLELTILYLMPHECEESLTDLVGPGCLGE